MNTEERALKLLGSGTSQEVVATALGVSPSYISQLLAKEDFAQKVAELRFVSLQDATNRDGKYDEIEDKLLKKLEDILPYFAKPREIVSAIVAINGAKRRGAKNESNIHVQQTVVQLNLPGAIKQAFLVDPNNQVVQVGERDLTTIDAKSLLSRLKTLPLPKGVYDGNYDRETNPEGVGTPA